MLVRDVYKDCLMNESSSLAHYIHHLLQEKKISLDDDMRQIDLTQADHEKVGELVRNDFLGFRKIRIYSMKMSQNDFVFIFARSEEEATDFYFQKFRDHPLNCHEYPLDFELARGNEVISFRDMKKEYDTFPAVAGYFKRGR